MCFRTSAKYDMPLFAMLAASLSNIMRATSSLLSMLVPYDFKVRFIPGKEGKRGGSDDVNTDPSLFDPENSTRLYHLVHVKISLSDGPLQVKGGLAFVLKEGRKVGKIVSSAEVLDPSCCTTFWQSIIMPFCVHAYRL